MGSLEGIGSLNCHLCRPLAWYENEIKSVDNNCNHTVSCGVEGIHALFRPWQEY